MPMPDRLTAALADRYRIERELGAGGMATVYLAEDLKHDRRVAIKVLKPELAAVLGAERFVVEIKTTAALSHPHILPLFDSGEAGGFLYYVMPFIEGETIRDRLNRETQFSVDEAVRITREIADALDYAHRNGVIHRDIKPENILLHDGRAMVMDFGIALAVSAAAGGRMTETGLSLGTPHYMSPEQATADKAITGRSDIYSLASVCYEMLSAEPPHTGGTAQAIIMKIIAERARPVSELRKSVPPHIAGALEQALEKVPADRFDSAKAFAEALGSAGFTYGTTAASFDAAGGRALRGNRTTLAAAAVAAVALVIAAAGWMRTMPEAPFSRVDLEFGAVEGEFGDAALSPDGRMIAVSGQRDGTSGIFLRRLDGDAEFRFVDGTISGSMPSFSPDNEWIAFRRSSDQTLVKVRVGGGGAVTLVPAGTLSPYHPDWGADGRIAFTGPTGGGVVDASGGEVTPMPAGYGRKVSLLPDGSGLLSSISGNLTLWAFDTDSFALLLPGGTHPVYSPTGHLLYAGTDGGLFAVGFDLKGRRVTGAPVRVLERVAATISSRGFALSASGLLLQHDARGTAAGSVADHLLIVDPAGSVDTVRVPVATYRRPHFSRDGRQIAMEVVAPERPGQTDIYTTDLVTGTFTQLTFEGDSDQPVWSPDGKWLAFSVANQDGQRMCVKPADNSAPERCLAATRHGDDVDIAEWLDDSTLLYRAITPQQRGEIFTVSLGADSTPRPYLQTPFNEAEPRRSPDGSLIVFESNETGSYQLWMRDFPVPKGRWNLSRAPAFAPRWSPDGRYVYFWRPGPYPAVDTLFRVRIERAPNVVVRDAEVVHTVDMDGMNNWDLHPDGRRILLTVAAATPEPAAGSSAGAAPVDRHLLLQNWFSELRRLTASAR